MIHILARGIGEINCVLVYLSWTTVIVLWANDCQPFLVAFFAFQNICISHSCLNKINTYKKFKQDFFEVDLQNMYRNDIKEQTK